MNIISNPYADAIVRQGFACVPAVFTAHEIHALRDEIERGLAQIDDDAVALRNRAGVYGARNILDVCPATRDTWRMPALVDLLREVLGDDFGLVRGLYFDKPPERSWSLPWHQDLTIAVADNRLPTNVFRRPTTKAGVPHVEAPPAILARMLTLRIHLDEVTDENGPLMVLPGSHHAAGNQPPRIEPVAIRAASGDVLAMRPLLFHASGASIPGTNRHRRVLHLEFAADRTLPDGYAWRTFRAARWSGAA
jgi:hypothetical protein